MSSNMDLRLGDFRTELKNVQDVHFMLTDPPYGNFFRHSRAGYGYKEREVKYKHAGNHAVVGDDLKFLDEFFVGTFR